MGFIDSQMYLLYDEFLSTYNYQENILASRKMYLFEVEGLDDSEEDKKFADMIKEATGVDLYDEELYNHEDFREHLLDFGLLWNLSFNMNYINHESTNSFSIISSVQLHKADIKANGDVWRFGHTTSICQPSYELDMEKYIYLDENKNLKWGKRSRER